MVTNEHALLAYRRKTGLTLEALAERARTSRSMLSRVEQRKALPSLGLVSRLVAATGGAVSADDFLPNERDAA